MTQQRCCCEGFCCGTGNQCSLLSNHGAPWLGDFSPSDQEDISDAIFPRGHGKWYSRLGARFDVLSSVIYSEIYDVRQYASFSDYPGTYTDVTRTQHITLEAHRTRYKLIPAGLIEDDLEEALGPAEGTGWVLAFTLFDRDADEASAEYWADPDAIDGTWEDTNNPKSTTGPIGAAMPDHLKARLPIDPVTGLSRLLQQQNNIANAFNPGVCDGLAWNATAFFDSINYLGFGDDAPVGLTIFGYLDLVADNFSGGFGYWDQPVFHFPGIDGSGTPNSDVVSGPTQLKLVRQGGSFAARPLLIFIDHQLPGGPSVVDFTVRPNRVISGGISVNHAIEDSSLVINAGVGGPDFVIDNAYRQDVWGQIDHNLSLNLSARVVRISPCDGDTSLPEFPCDQGSLIGRLAYPCEADSNLEPIAYNPASRPADGVTMTWAGNVYVPTETPTDLPIKSVVWSDSACGEFALLAQPCDGIGDPVAFDPDTRGAGDLTFEVEGKIYTPTAEPTSQDPVAGTWLTTDCPEPTYYLAYPCSGGGGPVRYTPYPGVAPGDGVVYTFIESIGATGGRCINWAKLNPTSTVTTDTTLTIGAHRDGECGLPPHKGFQGDCFQFGEPSDVYENCDLPPEFRPPWCPNRSGIPPEGESMAMSAPPQRSKFGTIPEDYDPETSPDSPKSRGGCCSPPEGVD